MVGVFGLINACKPRGISSYDVIRRLRRRLPRRTRVGHAGTLDPLAEGVLVLCLGPATRLAELIQSREKEYLVDAELGAFSGTDDAEGELRPVPVAAHPAPEAVAAAVAAFVGTIEQAPPAYSAVKVGGHRAYRLARGGRAVEPSPRPVTIHELEVLAYHWPRLRLRAVCGRGTYVRSLVRDLGRRLGTGGYCLGIVRTRIGPFRADQAADMDALQARPLEELIIPAVEAVPPSARVPVDDDQVRRLAAGRPAPAGDVPPGGAKLLGAVDARGELVALVRPDPAAGCLRPVKVFRAET